MSTPPPASSDAPARLSPEQVGQARKVAMQSGGRVLEILAAQLGVGAQQFLSCLGETFSMPVYALPELQACKPAFDIISYTDAVRHECLALRRENGSLLVVYADPFDPGKQARLGELIPRSAEWGLVGLEDLSAELARLERTVRAMESFSDGPADSETLAAAFVEEISLLKLDESGSPVVRFVHSTLFDALRSDASDVHFETHATGMTVKYRLDGVLIVAGGLSQPSMAEQAISRIKVMAELDIAERRVPQDGRFKALIDDRAVDFRVSVMPSVFGEDAVIRVLDKRALVNQTMELRLDGLGFDASSIQTLRKLAKEAYGMMLVTGPTGSGKTTTLYASITEINDGQDKIVTIEDPVEYQLSGVLQIPVNEKKGLTFARGLRSILRHDPDKILVGEIRDPETAEIAVQAALTGHLVFTTVHANNVFDVIGRFTHMGVDPYSFVSAINGIVAQRLVRLNCPHCVADAAPDDDLLQESGLTSELAKDYLFRAGKGCDHCRGTGYKGRKAIAEVLMMTEEMRELIISRASVRILRETAARNGTLFLRQAALQLVQHGETTLQAINRVTLV
jgi:general secretion pathway protein E